MGHISGAASLRIVSEFQGWRDSGTANQGVVAEKDCLAKSHILSGLCGDAQQVPLSDQSSAV